MTWVLLVTTWLVVAGAPPTDPAMDPHSYYKTKVECEKARAKVHIQPPYHGRTDCIFNQ